MPISELAADIVKRNGGSARLAIERLPEYELICQVCLDTFDQLQDEDWDSLPDPQVTALDYYRNMVDCDSIDRCTLDWLRQNY